MLIEQSAYANRWRGVSPFAKGAFALSGLLAAFLAATPLHALAIALLVATAAVTGAGVRPALYLRVALPPLGFLALSSLSFFVSIAADESGLAWRFAPEAWPAFAVLAARSCAALSALLFLVLTTPLPDLLYLLRCLRVPGTLLDLMVLCYRMLFVFSEALHDTLTAQSARLGYANTRLSLRSLGLLAANLAVQVWQRAEALHRAAQSRAGDGPLCFLPPRFERTRSQTLAGGVAGVLLVALAVAGRS